MLSSLRLKDSRPLHEIFWYLGQTDPELIFIAINFENIESIGSGSAQNFEIGLDIISITANRPISTHYFTTRSPIFQEKAALRFVSGESIVPTEKDMLRSIKSLIPLNRPVVLIGLGIRNDLLALDKLQLLSPRFKSPSSIPSTSSQNYTHAQH